MAADRDRRLTWLLGASAFANLGDGIAKVAFPLIAARLTQDPLLIAGLSAAQFVPWLLFGLLAGAMLDRVDRRRAMVLANSARAAAVGATALLIHFDAATIWVVYVAALVVGIAETVADSAANVLIPSVVDRGGLSSANSKLQATEIVGQTFLGGPVGSLTFALFAAFPFLLNSAAFALGAALLAAMAGSYHPRRGGGAEEPAPTRTAVRADIAEGLRWLRGNRLLLRLLIVAGLINLVSEMAQAQLVLYALDDLLLSEAAFGLFALVGGAGGLAGAAVAPRLTDRVGSAPTLVGGVVAGGAAFLAMGMSDQPVVSGLLFGVFAAAIVAVNVVVATARHTLVPEELLGRVLGVWRTVVWGALPVGALLGGVTTRWLGTPSATFVLSGVALLGVAVLAAVTVRGHDLTPAHHS
ncbi:MFS transporter [Saccharomonospora piscinae]|uniref:MFS transporter n=1 Tax=Saccharomonospora piscinae TaxID=687388 RepID=A0A1V9A167_SACPI|nr:MFS transporter [Saccharomonospora piscinae]OQO90810.1 MFS transporter [Saccharomonospora piscinae]TLW93485.1 MFS transporter [Saccharomonospora piscinae]